MKRAIAFLPKNTGPSAVRPSFQRIALIAIALSSAFASVAFPAEAQVSKRAKDGTVTLKNQGFRFSPPRGWIEMPAKGIEAAKKADAGIGQGIDVASELVAAWVSRSGAKITVSALSIRKGRGTGISRERIMKQYAEGLAKELPQGAEASVDSLELDAFDVQRISWVSSDVGIQKFIFTGTVKRGILSGIASVSFAIDVVMPTPSASESVIREIGESIGSIRAY